MDKQINYTKPDWLDIKIISTMSSIQRAVLKIQQITPV